MHRKGETIKSIALRQLIHDFIAERKQLKLDKLSAEDSEGRAQLEHDFTPEVWLADAVRRSSQIQLATHTLKPIHPDARGSSLFVINHPERPFGLVGSHCLNSPDDDVVGNAAALDVFKLLKLSHDGQTLLQKVLAGDADLQAALSKDPQQAAAWMQALADVTEGKTGLASHTLAKQLYFPLPDGGYHVLAPLFPSALVHRAQRRMRNDRFSDAAKAARTAWHERLYSDSGFREYPYLLIQKFGGTKPQNISQLNSERYGENWLLPALPPVWRTPAVRLPLRVESVFVKWLQGRREIRRLTRELRDFLAGLRPDYTNIDIRDFRAELVRQIVDEVLLFASELQDYPAGWSAAEDCELDVMEACWLDPYRAEDDPEFRQLYTLKTWQDEVADRFGNWFNSVIETDATRMGSPEQQEWSGILAKELRFFREVI